MDEREEALRVLIREARRSIELNRKINGIKNLEEMKSSLESAKKKIYRIPGYGPEAREAIGEIDKALGKFDLLRIVLHALDADGYEDDLAQDPVALPRRSR